MDNQVKEPRMDGEASDSSDNSADADKSAASKDTTELMCDRINRAAEIGELVANLKLSEATLRLALNDVRLGHVVREEGFNHFYQLASEMLATEPIIQSRGQSASPQDALSRFRGPKLARRQGTRSSMIWRRIPIFLNRHRVPVVARHWTFVGLGLTVVACYFVATSQWQAALGFI